MALPVRLLVNVSVADIRREPAHESEMTTQALLGWPLRVIARADEGRWFQVRLPDGYKGWIRSWLTTPAPSGWPGQRVGEIDAALTWLRSAPDAAADPVAAVVVGNRLPVLPARHPGWLLLGLPDGRAGWISRSELLGGRPLDVRAPRRPPRVSALLQTARRFMGVPYLWGGRSVTGLDCSGLIQLTLELHGLDIPRDARDQRTHLERYGTCGSDPVAARAGELIFFGKDAARATHVGFATGGGGLLHAQGRVRQDSLDPVNPVFRRDLRELFQVVCTVPGLKMRG